MNKSLPHQAVQWQQQRLRLRDQRCVPERVELIDSDTAQAAHSAIQDMLVAPLSSIDQHTSAAGAQIAIALRDARKNSHFGERHLSEPDVPAWNPDFAVTPAALSDVVVTEKGVIEQPDQAKIAALFAL